MHFPDQDLRCRGRGDSLATLGGEAHRISGSQGARGFHVDLAPGNEDVRERRVRHDDGLAGRQSRDVQRRETITDADGRAIAVGVHAGGHDGETTGQLARIEFDLFVPGIDAGLVGNHPHLDEVHGRLVSIPHAVLPRVVLLRMQDAGAGTHALGESGIQDATVADGVLMDQRSVEHPGDDLHVAVRVRVEPGAGGHLVVVVDQQNPVVGVGRVPVIAEREGMTGVQPADAGVWSVVGASNVDEGGGAGRHAISVEPKSDYRDVMASVNTGRYTANLGADGKVLFLIGMRFNKLWQFWKWLPVFVAMPRMLTELRKNPSLGLVGEPRTFLSGRTVLVWQYWESFEKLAAYSRSTDNAHLPAWRAFNRKVRDNGSVGIYHETILLSDATVETVYANMPAFGLGRVTGVVAAAKRGQTARGRMTGTDAEAPAVDPY